MTTARPSPPDGAAFIQHGWNAESSGSATSWAMTGSGWNHAVPKTAMAEQWALAIAATRSPSPGIRDWALKLFEEAAPYADELGALRAKAFAGLAGLELLQAESITTWPVAASCQLMHFHYRYARDDWDWSEPELAYDNARLPELLNAEWRFPKNRRDVLWARNAALAGSTSDESARHFPAGRLPRFLPPYATPLAFDQQPIEAAATIDAAAAYQTTGEDEWRMVADDAFAGSLAIMMLESPRGPGWRLLRRADGDRDQPQPRRGIDPFAASRRVDDAGGLWRAWAGQDASSTADTGSFAAA